MKTSNYACLVDKVMSGPIVIVKIQPSFEIAVDGNRIEQLKAFYGSFNIFRIFFEFKFRGMHSNDD